jgi:hypothetical protein
MLIRCPQCDRAGEIPDRFGLAAHKIRCRVCEARFLTTTRPAIKEIDRPSVPIERSSNPRIVGNLAPIPELPVSVSPDDDDDSTLDTLDLNDSHYELTVVNDEEIDDSQVELPAFTSEDVPSSDEIAVLTDDPPSEETLIGDPRHANLTDPRRRYRFAATLTAGVLLLAILAYFMHQGIFNGQPVSSAITALIAGCLGLGGVVLLILSVIRRPITPSRGRIGQQPSPYETALRP